MAGQLDAAALPARLGRYEVGAAIASGGMATVYLARMSGPAGFEKLVALKRVHPHLAQEPAFVEMFLDEARIASRIQHPNVCQVFDFGQTDGAYFIAMEFLVGETLAKVQRAIARSDYLNDPRRPLACVRLIVDACEGLHAAHELRDRDGELMNVVHRDISPQNLFVTFDGHAKVVDFGIASASGRLHQTSSGTVKGKFSYMAPEQAMGKTVDRRADVFSLGVVLWELLAFKRLFRRDTPGESLAALLNEEIGPPSERSRLAPPEFDPIVLRALERDPDKRYPTARELGRDLARAAGRLGDVVDRAELSEWLEGLFPEGRRRHEIMLESARWGEAGDVTEQSEPSVSEVISRSSWSGIRSEELLGDIDVEMLPEESDLAGDATVAEPDKSTSPSAEPEPAPTQPSQVTPHLEPAPPRRRSAAQQYAAMAIVFLLISISTGVALFALFRGDPPEVADTAQTHLTPVAAPDMSAAAPRVEPTPTETEAIEAEATETEPAGETGAPTESAAGTDASSDRRRVRRRRRRRAARNPPVAQGTGTVIVSTPGGWANVYNSNGQFLGETPLTIQLPAGRHRLSLRPFGQPPSRNATVNVTAGSTSRVRQPL